jgi:hypothetical protein
MGGQIRRMHRRQAAATAAHRSTNRLADECFAHDGSVRIRRVEADQLP